MNPKAKMGQPITMPGVWGLLARAMGGVGSLSKTVGVADRTLRAWARNERPLHDALVASKITDLCRDHDVNPLLFESPAKGTFLGCTPRDGWVSFPEAWDGWSRRTRIVGLPDPKWEKATHHTVESARKCGWPY